MGYKVKTTSLLGGTFKFNGKGGSVKFKVAF